MIITVTLNPALDHIVTLAQFQRDGINRVQSEYLFPGGKGVNVSLVLTRLGTANRALGFVAGATGLAYRTLLADMGIEEAFLTVSQGSTRVNTKVSADTEFEINGQGPQISEDELGLLCEQMKDLKSDDFLVLSGSVPSGIQDAYVRIAESVRNSGAEIVADTTGDGLLKLLAYRPFLVKPNVHELSEIMGTEIHTNAQFFDAAKSLQTLGARNVLISAGGDGARLLTETGKQWSAAGVHGTVSSTVGAGDSMVAGYLYGWHTQHDEIHALRYAVAAGTASAFSFGIAGTDAIKSYLEQVVITEII